MPSRQKAPTYTQIYLLWEAAFRLSNEFSFRMLSIERFRQSNTENGQDRWEWKQG